MRTKLLSENFKGRDNLEDSGIDGKITLQNVVGRFGFDGSALG
jgi:hypothetical protein